MKYNCCANKPRKENYFCKKVRTLLINLDYKLIKRKTQKLKTKIVMKVLVENETIQINVPTRNRFSVLNTLNTEPNEFDKNSKTNKMKLML